MVEDVIGSYFPVAPEFPGDGRSQRLILLVHQRDRNSQPVEFSGEIRERRSDDKGRRGKGELSSSRQTHEDQAQIGFGAGRSAQAHPSGDKPSRFGVTIALGVFAVLKLLATAR